jgi:dihydroneopterin triphosphate diphosphatase
MIDRENIQAIIYTRNPNLHILVLKRVQSKGGFWQPVSGGVIPNEELVDAVKREVFEETGITNIEQILDLQYSFIFETSKSQQKMMMKDYCFGVEVEQETCVMLSNEHDEYRWCKIEDANKYIKWDFSRMAIQKVVEAVEGITSNDEDRFYNS